MNSNSTRRSSALLVLGLLSLSAASGCNAWTGLSFNESGRAYYRTGRYDMARAEFKRASLDSPFNAVYTANMAGAMQKKGDILHAEQTYRRALDQNPSHQPAWHGLAKLMVDTGRPDEARSLLQSWVGSQPYSPDAHLEMAWLEQEVGNHAGAKPWLEQALRANPRHPKVLAHIGQYYQKTGQQRQALTMYQRSLESDWYQPQVQNRVKGLMATRPSLLPWPQKRAASTQHGGVPHAYSQPSLIGMTVQSTPSSPQTARTAPPPYQPPELNADPAHVTVATPVAAF